MNECEWVKLLLTMPEHRVEEGQLPSLEAFVVSSARVSYLGQNKGYERDLRLLEFLYVNKHTVPFEMPTFVFRIEAPMVVFQHFVRHRMASYNVQSGRYTRYDDVFYVPDPDMWRLQSTENKQASSSEMLTPLEGAEFTARFKELLESSYKLYTDMLTANVSREMARLVLPGFSVYTTFQMKVDLHNLLHFFRLRLSKDVQWETRWYAQQMFALVEPLVPNVCRLFRQENPHLFDVEGESSAANR